MTSRREFLQIGVAASAFPVAQGLLRVGPVAAAEARSVTQPIPLYKVLFDERYSEGRTFGAAAERHGASVLGINGDVTDFWFNDLDLRWRDGREAIAGFTTYGPMFVLERLAWDRGLKIVFQAEHRPLSSGSIEHRLVCRQPSLDLAAPLINAGDSWSRVMADVVMQCPAGPAESAAQTLITPGDHRLPEDDPFFSWVIASRA